MNFKQLEAFYWLTRLHSFHLVADHLGLTQPAVSARIAGLEDEFGVKLIDRSAPEFRLTEPGHEIAEFAERFMNMHEAMVSRLKQSRRRRFSIGLVGPAALTWGNILRRRLLAERSDGIFDFHAGSNEQLRQAVNAGGLDMAFLTTRDLGLQPISGSFGVNYTVGWVATPEIAAMCTCPLSPEDLRGLPLVLYPRTSPLYSPVADYIEETRQRPAGRHYGNSLSTLASMVRHGYGASALPLAVLEQEIADGRLVELAVKVPLAPFEVRCVHLNSARKKDAAAIMGMAREAALDWCTAHPRYSTFLT